MNKVIFYSGKPKEKLETELNSLEKDGFRITGITEVYIFLNKKDDYNLTQNTTTTSFFKKNKR